MNIVTTIVPQSYLNKVTNTGGRKQYHTSYLAWVAAARYRPYHHSLNGSSGSVNGDLQFLWG